MNKGMEGRKGNWGGREGGDSGGLLHLRIHTILLCFFLPHLLKE